MLEYFKLNYHMTITCLTLRYISGLIKNRADILTMRLIILSTKQRFLFCCDGLGEILVR